MGSFIAAVLTFIFLVWVVKCSKKEPKNQQNITAQITVDTNNDGSTILTKMANNSRVGVPGLLPSEASQEKIRRTAEEMAEKLTREYPSLR